MKSEASSGKPAKIRHIVLDADDTIWDILPGGIASGLRPLESTQGNELLAEDFYGADLGFEEKRRGREKPPPTKVKVRLDPTLRETLKKLRAQGIEVSMASHNTKEDVLGLLDAFGLTDQFKHLEVGHVEKGRMVENIAKAEGIDPREIIFVDDSVFNIVDVARTGALALKIGGRCADINSIEEIIPLIDLIDQGVEIKLDHSSCESRQSGYHTTGRDFLDDLDPGILKAMDELDGLFGGGDKE